MVQFMLLVAVYGDGRKILEREYKYISSGRAFEDLELRKKLIPSLVELLAVTLIF